MIVGPLKEQLDEAWGMCVCVKNPLLTGTSTFIWPVVMCRPPEWLWLFFVVLVISFLIDKKQLKARGFLSAHSLGIAHYSR